MTLCLYLSFFPLLSYSFTHTHVYLDRTTRRTGCAFSTGPTEFSSSPTLNFGNSVSYQDPTPKKNWSRILHCQITAPYCFFLSVFGHKFYEIEKILEKILLYYIFLKVFKSERSFSSNLFVRLSLNRLLTHLLIHLQLILIWTQQYEIEEK